MKRIILGIITILTLSANCSCWGSPARKMEIYYFYSNICEQCDEKGKFFTMFNDKTGDLQGTYPYSLMLYSYFQPGAEAKLEALEMKYQVKTEVLFPILFINDKVLQGENEIQDNLRDVFIQEGELEIQK